MTLFGDFTTNVPVTFQKMRAMLGELEGMQEGVVGATDYKVVQRGAGANMSVDVGVGAAWTQVDTGARNGLSHTFNDAVANVAVAAAHATLPRLDQVVLQYNDSSIPAGVGGDTPTLRVIQGTPTSGATLANRTGAASLPNDCTRLADVLVPAAAVSILTANIADRRQWARGAYRRIVRNANAAAGNDYTLTPTTFTAVDATNLAITLECSGAPLTFRLHGRLGPSSASDTKMVALVDGTPVDNGGSTTEGPIAFQKIPVDQPVAFDWDIVPSAGRHVFQPAIQAASGTVIVRAQAAMPLQLVVQEVVRPSADNT